MLGKSESVRDAGIYYIDTWIQYCQYSEQQSDSKVTFWFIIGFEQAFINTWLAGMLQEAGSLKLETRSLKDEVDISTSSIYVSLDSNFDNVARHVFVNNRGYSAAWMDGLI